MFCNVLQFFHVFGISNILGESNCGIASLSHKRCFMVLHHCHASDALCSSERADANDGGRMDTSESKTQLAGCKRELEKDDSATDGMYSLWPHLLAYAILVAKHVSSCIQSPCGSDARSYLASARCLWSGYYTGTNTSLTELPDDLFLRNPLHWRSLACYSVFEDRGAVVLNKNVNIAQNPWN